MTFFTRLLQASALAVLWAGLLPVQGQQMTRIRGKVTDAATNEPLPFVNIAFVGKTIGTTTDFDGSYVLESQWGSDRIQASYIGYEPQVRKIESGKSQVVNIKLKSQTTQLKEVTIVGTKRYRNKGNPAVELIRNVIDHKNANRKENLDYYSYDKYEKVEFDLNNVTEKFKNRRIMRKFQFVFNYVDTSELNGKPYLPLWFKESRSKVYYRKEPENEKEYISGTMQVGFEGYIDNQGLSSYIDNLYQDINIYDNNIDLLTNQFVSPISSIAPVYYKYFIVDTVDVRGVRCINLAFITRNKSDWGFTGNLFITMDSSYAVKKVDMGVPNNINLNWVQGMRIVQEYDMIGQAGRMLTRDEITIDFSITKKGKGLQGKKTTTYENYSLNEPLPDSLFRGLTREVLVDSALERPESYWDTARPEALTETEKGIYEMIDSVQNVPAFKNIMNTIFLLITGYTDVGPVSIGPVGSFYSFNEVEGWRGRFGFKTLPAFSNKFLWETYVAYGFSDHFKDHVFTDKERFKHFNALTYTFNKDNIVYPYHFLRGSFQHDSEIPGQKLQFVAEDNFLLSFKRGVNDKMFFNDLSKLEYLRERRNGITYHVTLSHLEQRPFGDLHFDYLSEAGIVPREKILTSEAELDFRFAPNERFYQGKVYRIPIFTKYPIFRLTGTFGFQDVLNSNYQYQKVQFAFFKRIFVSPFGFGDLNIEAGKVFGRVPFPLLTFPKANQTYSYQLESYNLMNFLEFINDQFVAVNYQHFFNGFFFNKIPLFKRLELREACSIKVLYGSVTENNRPENHPDELFLFPRDEDGKPVTFTMEKKPYIEVSAGIMNLFKLVRVEVIRRLTYLDNPGVSETGIRARAKFDF